MYGIVKCLPVSRRKSIRRSSPSQSRLLTMTAPPSARDGEKSRKRSNWPRSASDVGLQRRPDRAGCARTTARRGRRSSRCPRRRARPAGRRSAGGAAGRRSGRGGRRGASPRTGRSRCSRRSSGRSPGGPEARVSWRAGCRATRVQRGARQARSPAADVTVASVRGVWSGREASDRSFTLPMLSCGHSCTPASRVASATDGRSSVAPRRVARRSVESRSPSRSCCSSSPSSRPGPGSIFAVGTYNHYAAGLPDPKNVLTDLRFEQQTRDLRPDRQDRTRPAGRSSSARWWTSTPSPPR